MSLPIAAPAGAAGAPAFVGEQPAAASASSGSEPGRRAPFGLTTAGWARRMAPVLLATGAALSVASASNMVWWKTRALTESVEYESKFTLWSRTTTKVVDEPTTHGEHCDSSDECMEGTWCRNGGRRCWTDGDCQWHSHLSGKDYDCARMPRSDTHSTWTELCSAGKEVVPCGAAFFVRAAVFASAALVLLAAPCACWAAHLPAFVAVVGELFGLLAIVVAMTMNLVKAKLFGPGFALQLLALAFGAAGAFAAFRSKSLENEVAERDFAVLASRYGTSFKTLEEEEDDEAGAEQKVGSGSVIGRPRTLLQQRYAGDFALSAKQGDIEHGLPAACGGAEARAPASGGFSAKGSATSDEEP